MEQPAVIVFTFKVKTEMQSELFRHYSPHCRSHSLQELHSTRSPIRNWYVWDKWRRHNHSDSPMSVFWLKSRHDHIQDICMYRHPSPCGMLWPSLADVGCGQDASGALRLGKLQTICNAATSQISSKSYWWKLTQGCTRPVETLEAR